MNTFISVYEFGTSRVDPSSFLIFRSSGFEVLDPLERAAEAHAEDHADELDDRNSTRHGYQVDHVVLNEFDQGFRTSLEEDQRRGKGNKIRKNCFSRTKR